VQAPVELPDSKDGEMYHKTTGDVNITYDSGTKTLTSAIQSGVIVNDDINASADIVQSKLSMTLAGTASSAPTGTAAQKQAANGLASFDSDNFDVTDGWVSFKSGGILYANIQNVTADRMLGNLGASAGAMYEVIPRRNIKKIIL